MFRPLSDRVAIRPDPADTVSRGGIIIPGNVKERPRRGEVVAVGPGKDNCPPELSVGDRVIYGKYTGSEVVVKGEKLIIMREADVLVKI